MQKKVKLSKKLQIYIANDTYNNLDKISIENGRTISDLVREGINQIERRYKRIKSSKRNNLQENEA